MNFINPREAVQKEKIIGLEFVEREVLNSDTDTKKRKADLYRAMVLGNLYHVKTKIIFEASDGIHKVETTVWATTDSFVSLKGGITIPIKCIHEVIT